jgi:hypothetical protein
MGEPVVNDAAVKRDWFGLPRGLLSHFNEKTDVRPNLHADAGVSVNEQRHVALW